MKAVVSFALIIYLLVPQLVCAKKTISIGTSEAPPHTINGKNKGIDLDITALVLNKLGYQVNFHFFGLARSAIEVHAGRLDATTPIFWQEDKPGIYSSNAIINYLPTVFSLAKNEFSPKSLTDLTGHSIITFQGATGYFGEEFVMLSQQSHYHEVNDMSVIPQLLDKERFDYAVLDKYVFYYFYFQTSEDNRTDIFDEFNLIPQVPSSVAFHDKQLRDEFNDMLKQVKTTEEYQAIIKRYLNRTQP